MRKAQACEHCHGIGYDASGYACTCTMPAKVAKARAVQHDREILLEPTWRNGLRHLSAWVLGWIALLFCAVFVSSLAV